MDQYAISVHVCRTREELVATQEGVGAIYEGLGTNTTEKTGITELATSLRVFLRNRKEVVVGGAVAEIFGGWMYVWLLWIAPFLRGKGYGTQLMHILEQEALKLGCQNAHLDTFSFEARPFYEKLGYAVFATLNDYPPGYSKHFLTKTLTA